MKILYTPDPVRFLRMTTDEIRDAFLMNDLFQPDKVSLLYSDVDRTVVGSIVPVKGPLSPTASKELASAYFAERREIGILNIGAKAPGMDCRVQVKRGCRINPTESCDV